MIALVAAAVVRIVQHRAVAAVSRYLAERLAVPAVLCTAQRAGRPEVLSSAALEAIETLRAAVAGHLPHLAVGFLSAPLLLGLIFAHALGGRRDVAVLLRRRQRGRPAR